MFSKHHEHASYLDFSSNVRDATDWKLGELRTIDFPSNITAVAIEPVSALLATGTANGVIHIFGGPAVETKLLIPGSLGVRFLKFAHTLYQLLCVDTISRLHIWDLSNVGTPIYVTFARFDQVNHICVSPTHSHVFLSVDKGEIKTYDLSCQRKSPYTIPNMWKIYEGDMATKGKPSLFKPLSEKSVEAVIHPRNLNLLFIAYSGGVTLTDLTQRSIISAYEFVLPPGAPGGAGYGATDILIHRRPAVTALAIHPSGYFFAVGYDDGTIAFWGVEDTDHPLHARTVDVKDVNIVQAVELEKHMAQRSDPSTPRIKREAISRLSWSGFCNSSDPRGGETTLAILGGVNTGTPPGMSVFLLPAFNPPEPTFQHISSDACIHPSFRAAMSNSTNPTNIYYQPSRGVVQDILLIPTSNPHFSGSFDPYAIIFIKNYPADASTVSAYQYPPTQLTSTEGTEKDGPTLAFGDESVSLFSNLILPFPLESSANGLLDGYLMTVEKDVHDYIIGGKGADRRSIALKGGVALTDEENIGDIRLAKHQPRRLLVTHYADLSVQFHDMTMEILPTATTPSTQHFPDPLPYLNIDLKPVLNDPAIEVIISGGISADVSITNVQFAPDALECAVVLDTGEVIAYHVPRSHSKNIARARDSSDCEIIMLEHVQLDPSKKMVPFFLLTANRGRVEACSLSDIGFLAVAYKDGSVLIVDMRGPKIIARSAQRYQNQKRTPSMRLRSRSRSADKNIDRVMSLSWTVAAIRQSPQLSVRLITIRSSGRSEIYTLSQTGNPALWQVVGEPAVFKTASDFSVHGCFVLDSKTGMHLKADRRRLAMSVTPSIDLNSHAVLVAAGHKTVRSFAEINGEQIGKVDWKNNQGSVTGIQIVQHTGSSALVAWTERRAAYVYSLPHLEYICTLSLPSSITLPMSVDESGDYISWKTNVNGVVESATYGTFFAQRRASYLPNVDFACTRPSVPSQPQPVSMGPPSIVESWFTLNQTLSGTQIDELLGGPDRPVPVTPSRLPGASTYAATRAGIAASASAAQNSIYNRLTSAISERGQLLGDLQERINSLEEGSRNMVAEAKRLAAQRTAKSWFSF